MDESRDTVRPITLRNRCAGCSGELALDAVMVPDIGKVCPKCLAPGAEGFIERNPPQHAALPFYQKGNP